MMEVQDHSAIVRAVFDRGGFALDGHEACGRFTEACARALHSVDARWGHLRKSGAQNQYNGHAVDAVLWRDTGQAVDVLIASKAASPSSPARVGWGVDIARYGEDDWLQPEGVETPSAGVELLEDTPSGGNPEDPASFASFNINVRDSLGALTIAVGSIAAHQPGIDASLLAMTTRLNQIEAWQTRMEALARTATAPTSTPGRSLLQTLLGR